MAPGTGGYLISDELSEVALVVVSHDRDFLDKAAVPRRAVPRLGGGSQMIQGRVASSVVFGGGRKGRCFDGLGDGCDDG